MSGLKINVVYVNVSLLDGMASSTRVRNLLEPVIHDKSLSVSNLIYAYERVGEIEQSPLTDHIKYKVVDLHALNPFSWVRFLSKGFGFIHSARVRGAKNILYHYDYPDLKSVLFIIYAKMLGYKLVIDIIEDNDFVTDYVRFRHKVRIRSSRFILNMSRYLTDAYIAISGHLQTKLTALTNAEKVHLIPVSVNLKRFKVGDQDAIREEVNIFYGGSFAEKDGLSYLIAAFDKISKKYDNIKLILTGRGLQKDTEAIKAQVNAIEHKNRVKFMGYLDMDAYYALMNSCDIFCMTRNKSKYANAGFPFKLGEFLATGKSVIATRVGDVEKYLVDKKNALLIEPESVEDIVGAVSYCVNHKDAVSAMGAEARLTAENNFDSEKLARKLFDVFKQI